MADDEAPRAGESFLRRVHRRKTEARLASNPADTQSAAMSDQPMPIVADDEVLPELTDADMPPLATLGADSDYSGFMSSRVSESLRRAALRKLFHGKEFNVVDGLDDYAEDFTTFQALGDLVTADMRHMLEVEARKKAEAVKQALLQNDDGNVSAACETGKEEPAVAGQDTRTGGEETKTDRHETCSAPET